MRYRAVGITVSVFVVIIAIVFWRAMRLEAQDLSSTPPASLTKSSGLPAPEPPTDASSAPPTMLIPPHVTQNHCTILGMVYEPSGAPASGAVVSQRWRGDGRPRPAEDAPAPDAAEIITDAEGTFALHGLAPGTNILHVTHASGTAVTRVRHYRESSTTPVTIVLQAGESLTGEVRSRDGAAIAGARIMPLAHDGDETWDYENEARSVLSNSDGTFRLDGLAPGAWTLYASADGYGAAVTPAFDTGTGTARIVLEAAIALYCTVLDAANDRPLEGVGLRLSYGDFELPPAELRSGPKGEAHFTALGPGNYVLDVADSHYAMVGEAVKFTLDSSRKPEPVVIRVEVGGEIRGRITRSDTGQGLVGVNVEASTPGRNRYFSMPTDQEGHYALTGLPTGEFRVRPPRFVPGVAQDPDPRPEKTVAIAPGQRAEGIDFVLYAGALLAGTVVDVEGEPVGGATVHARNTEGAKRFATAYTGEDGRFAFADFPEEEAVELSAEASRGRSSVSGPHRAGAPGSDNIVIPLDKDCGGVIAGRVTDSRGRPFRCQIQAHTDDPALQYPIMPPVGETDGLGNFVMTTVCAAAYTLVMVPDSGIRQEFGPVSIPEGGSLTGLSLIYDQGELLEIAGSVVDSGGNPVADATVTAGASDGVNITSATSVRSAEDGTFVLRDLPEGTYRLAATREGYISSDDPVVEAGTGDVMLEMFFAPRVSGQVTDESGIPIAAFTVSLLRTGNAEAQPITQAVTDAEGRFDLSAPARSQWTLRVEAPGYLTTELELGLLRFDEVHEGINVALKTVEP